MAMVLALGLCAGCALTVSAESGAREAEISYREIKIVLDGQELCPRDAAGNEVEPFILDGTTYLPVRAVADALGLEVRWRGSDGTVLLSEPLTGSAFRNALPMPPDPPAPASESARGHQADERVTLAYRDVRVLVDGVVIEPKDAAGNAVEPFILDGTTYLPVRAVADALGLAVDWDGDSSTVRLSHWLVARSRMEFTYDNGISDYCSTAEYEYDGLGRLVYQLDRDYAGSIETRLSYDETGRLARRERLKYAPAESVPEELIWSRVTGYAYDAESGLCTSAETAVEYYGVGSFTDKAEYEYDALGRLTGMRDSYTRILGETAYGEERSYTRSYNEQGGIASESLTVRDNETSPVPLVIASKKGTYTYSYSYDGDGRLTAETLDGADKRFMLYDSDGDDVVMFAGNRTCSYDEHGRASVIKESERDEDGVESVVYVTEYGYDESGRCISVKSVESRPAKSSENVSVITWDENGCLIRYEHSGGFIIAGRTIENEYVKAGG